MTPHNTGRRNDSSTVEQIDPDGRGCTNIYCDRSESPLFRVERRDGKVRVLCYEHALDFGGLDEEDLDGRTRGEDDEHHETEAVA